MLNQLTAFQKTGAYMTHSATWPMIDITECWLSDYMQLPLEPQKAVYHFFHMQQYCQRHFRLCKTGGVIL